MSKVKLMDYLGGDISNLLNVPPLSGWEATRSVEVDPPKKEIWYEFVGHGVDVICDEAERVRTIFLHRGDGEALCDVPFAFARRDVLRRYGTPSKSGERVRIAGLGERGPWDRFALSGSSIHFQYSLDRDEIDMVTLMRPAAVPPTE